MTKYLFYAPPSSNMMKKQKKKYFLKPVSVIRTVYPTTILENKPLYRGFRF